MDNKIHIEPEGVRATFDDTFTTEEKRDWEKHWAELGPSAQREMWERLAITPLKIVVRPWWQKIAVAPVAFWKHYKLSRKHMGRFHSLRWAFVWTGLLLFPKLFVK
jgi:hypothetical protein